MDVFQPAPSGLVLVILGEARPPHRVNADLDSISKYPVPVCKSSTVETCCSVPGRYYQVPGIARMMDCYIALQYGSIVHK